MNWVGGLCDAAVLVAGDMARCAVDEAGPAVWAKALVSWRRKMRKAVRRAEESAMHAEPRISVPRERGQGCIRVGDIELLKEDCATAASEVAAAEGDSAWLKGPSRMDGVEDFICGCGQSAFEQAPKGGGGEGKRECQHRLTFRWCSKKKAYECKKFTPRGSNCGRLDKGSKNAENLRTRSRSSFKPRQMLNGAMEFLYFKSTNGKKSNKDMAAAFEKLGCQHTNIKSVKAAAMKHIEVGDLWQEAKLLEPAQKNIEDGGGVFVVRTAPGNEFLRMVDDAYRQKHKRAEESEKKRNPKHKDVPYDPAKHRPDVSAIVPDVEYVVGWILISNAALAAAADKRALLGDVLTCDASHKTGMDAGTIYNVMARDSDGHNFHFAHAHFIGNENGATWKLVLETLRGALDKANAAHPRVFISDRDKGIKSALEGVFPKAVPFMCRVHFERNLKSNFGNFALVRTLYNAC